MTKEILASIFETITKQVWSDGGYGCALIYCKNKDYKEVSNHFKNYVNNINWINDKSYVGGYYYDLIEGEDYHLWTDKSNENFLFTSNRNKIIEDLQQDISDSYIITV